MKQYINRNINDSTLNFNGILIYSGYFIYPVKFDMKHIFKLKTYILRYDSNYKNHIKLFFTFSECGGHNDVIPQDINSSLIVLGSDI